MSSGDHPISTLNPYQQRNLRISCEHIESLLQSIEEALSPTHPQSPFPRYVYDVPPAQRKAIEEYIPRIREQLLRVLAGQAIELEKPRFAASHVIHTALTFIEIATEELSPGRMRAYGPVSDAGAADLRAIMQELQSIVYRLHRYVMPPSERAAS